MGDKNNDSQEIIITGNQCKLLFIKQEASIWMPTQKLYEIIRAHLKTLPVAAEASVNNQHDE